MGVEVAYVALMAVFAYLSVNTKTSDLIQLIFLMVSLGFGLVATFEAYEQGATMGMPGNVVIIFGIFIFVIFLLYNIYERVAEWLLDVKQKRV